MKERKQAASCGAVARLCAATKPIMAFFLSALLAAAPLAGQIPSSSPPTKTPGPPADSHPAPHIDKDRARAAHEVGRQAEQAGNWKAAFSAYSEAATADPNNREYAILKEHSRFEVVQGMVDSAERSAVAGDLPGARALLQGALDIDPSYSIARERLSELSSITNVGQRETGHLAGLPKLIRNSGARSFDFRGTTRGAYQELGRQFGVTFAFDGDLPETPVRLRLPDVNFDTALDVLSRETKTFTRVVDPHTVFVTENTAEKIREYTPVVEKEIVLPSSVSTEEMNEAVRLVREMTGIGRTQLDSASRTLTVRSTEQNVELAQALVDQLEQPPGEVMLEIEILEVDRNEAEQLGIAPPTSSNVFMLTLPEIQQLQTAQGNGTLLQVLQSLFGSNSALSSASGALLVPLLAFGGGKTIFLATMPTVTANFNDALSAVRSADRILIRAQDGKPATFFVGDRYPVTLSLLSSDVTAGQTALAQGLLSGTLPRTDYNVGKGPVSLATADFNADGHPDMVVANQADGTISILLGVGDGTFGTQTPITVPAGSSPSTPSAVTTGDFNNDGKPDIAVADSANNQVWIFLGNGDGTFQAPVAYATGSTPVALVAHDFDGDGQPDLAIVNQGDGKTTGTISVLLGNKTGSVQDGTFAPKVDYAVGVDPVGITSADFNSDGTADLAVTNHGDNTVSVLLGQSDGTFGTESAFPTGNGPWGVAAADFNSDGHQDLAVANQTDSTVSVLLGDGKGTFATHVDYATGSEPTGIIAATFGGTTPDIATADQTANNVGVLIGNGDGTFVTPITVPTGNGPVAVVASDLASSGALDVISANNAANTITVTLNTVSSSTNTPASQTPYPGSEYVDLGLKVKATPRLHANGDVTLQLQFDIKSLSGSAINGIPILTNRSIEQTVRLREGETSVISGILQRSNIRSVSGTPWSSTLPAIGLLTGEQSNSNQDTELLIVVTPRALRLPPHDMPALYAGRGEPATPPSAAPPSPAPGVAVPPGARREGAPQPGEGQQGQPGQQPSEPNGQPTPGAAPNVPPFRRPGMFQPPGGQPQQQSQQPQQ